MRNGTRPKEKRRKQFKHDGHAMTLAPEQA